MHGDHSVTCPNLVRGCGGAREGINYTINQTKILFLFSMPSRIADENGLYAVKPRR